MTQCAGCHPAGYSLTAVNATKHMDGVKDFSGCDGCHGDNTPARVAVAGADANVSAAPPKSHLTTSTITAPISQNGVGLHIRHVNDSSTEADPLLCVECHVTADASHPENDGEGDVRWGTLANKAGTANWNDTTGTCSNVYCHNPTPSTPGTVPAPTFFATNNLACVGCHGNAASLTSNAHEMHVADAGAYKGETYGCVQCHTTVSNDTTIANKAAHVDGTVQMQAAVTWSGTSCSASTCHKDGTETPGYVNVAWTSGTAGGSCNECHGRLGGVWTSAWGEPNYTERTTTNDDVRNSHSKHVSTVVATAKTQCVNCHDTTISATGTLLPGGTHLDGTVQVTAGATKKIAGTYTQTGETCTSITCHGNGSANWGGPALVCADCHNGTLTITVGPLTGQTRRNVVAEFKSTWSHKASTSATPGSRTSSQWDCIVCHMEGTKTTGSTDSTYHANGLINLRDPDTGLNIKGVTFTQTVFTDRTNGGYYTSTATDAAPARFSRNLSNGTIEPDVAAIMINQCIKCHDGNGASSTDAQVPTGGTAGRPFGVAIGGGTAGYAGTAGLTACAGTTDGCVVNVAKSFATTNASYHPVLGKQNNSYTGAAKMNAPWNVNSKVAGTINATTSWGQLISCWDCHAQNGVSGVQTISVTAHGGTTTLRQNVWSSSTTSTANLCRVCHNVSATINNSMHGAGSAAASASGGGDASRPGGYMVNRCYYCHASATTRPARPLPGEEAHGFDKLVFTLGTDTMWPVGATNSFKPYGFLRGTAIFGTGGMWKPLTGPGIPAGGALCGGSGSICGNTSGSYYPGGVY
jgi:predicted CxxxxCH...CXXCH cytochrome family protein